MRIVLLGPSCSGKSTLAARLSASLAIPRVEMDDMIWQPGWERLDRGLEGKAEFRARCRTAVAGSAWVCAGAWSSGRDIVYARADTIVSIDLGLWCIFSRMLRRTFSRISSGRAVCNGNYETLAHLFSRHSIFRYFWKQWPRQRGDADQHRHLEELQRDAPHATVIYLSSEAAVEAWAARLEEEHSS